MNCTCMEQNRERERWVTMNKKMIALAFSIFMVAGILGGCQRQLFRDPVFPNKVDQLEQAPPAEEPKPAGQPEENPKEKIEETLPDEEPEEPKEEPKEEAKQEEPLPKEEPKEEAKPEASLPKEEPKEEAKPASEPLVEKTDSAEAAIQQASVSAPDTDKKKIGWGSGGPTDKEGRPDGAVVYQKKYGPYGADFIKTTDEKKIYLTFDEGYENGFTSRILDILKEKQVPATFFVTMPYAKSQPDLVQRMIEEGHTVGNHSVNHPSFPDTDPEQCRHEVMDLHEYVKKQYGYEMSLFRFPMGEFSTADLQLLHELGYTSVFWSFAHRDWDVNNQPDSAETLTKAVSKAHPGAIYLLHAVSETNTNILPQLIDDLRAQGYTFVSYQG